MTKDIMLRISGVQFPDGEENSEEMEVITSGSYFEKDGRHYIKYDEVQEDSNEVIRNLLKIENGSLELTRRGMTNVHMVFEKDKKSESYYDTPFGRFLVGISATHLDVSEKEDSIDAFFKLDNKFHKLIYQAGNKNNGWRAGRRVSSHYDRVRYLDAIMSKTDLEAIQKEHEKIFHMLLIGYTKDFDLKEFYDRHLGIYRKNFQNILEQYPEYFGI